MDKNWLIRTKSNHILGPISKEKVLELYHNNSIKPDDEVSCGNGFWFYVREDDMVERFVLGNEIQSFNPISEAKDVLTHPVVNNDIEHVPKNDDITMVGGLNLAMLKEEPPQNPVNEEAPKAPVVQEVKPATAATHKEEAKEPKKKNNQVTKKSKPTHEKKPLKKQSYLKYVGIIGFLFLFLLVYFRKTIIRSLFQGEMTNISFSIMNEAHAQENLPAKKKSF